MARILVVDDIGQEAYMDVPTVEIALDEQWIVEHEDGRYRLGPRWGAPPAAVLPTPLS